MSIELLKKLANGVEEEEKKSPNAPVGEEEGAVSEEPEEAEEAEQEEAAATGTVNPVAVMDFFAQQQGNITDADFHSFCEQNGFNVHEAESIAYGLAQKLMQILREGKSVGLDPNTVDPQQLEWGMKIESEHTSCPALQKKISLDHIAENPQYYSMPYMQEELQREASQGQEKMSALLQKIAAPSSGLGYKKKMSRPVKKNGSMKKYSSLLVKVAKKNKFQKLKDNKVPLTDEERSLVMSRKATWNHGPNGEATPAVWKSVNKNTGKTTFVTNTHRAYNTASTVAGAIKRYHDFIKGTA